MRKMRFRKHFFRFGGFVSLLLLAIYALYQHDQKDPKEEVTDQEKMYVFKINAKKDSLNNFKFRKEITNQEKIIIIERSIRSPLNQGICKIPWLPVDNPEVMKFYMPHEKLNCGDSLDDWVMCEKSICFVKPEITAVHGDVVCSYTDLIRKTDYKVKYGVSTRTKNMYVLQASDFVKVACKAESGSSWVGLAFGIRDSVDYSVPIAPHSPYNILNSQLNNNGQSSPLFYNVLIFGFDSMSRNAVIRKLPKTYAYLTNKLGSIVLQGYNIVGDGTPQALVPLLTGYTELELPETRHRMPNAQFVNVYPMIWKEYKSQGYVTSFNEDVPSIGTFTYRMTGFEKQPVDHYLRTFYVEAENSKSTSRKHCIGHQADHVVMLEYTKNFMTKYKDAPRFVFSFHGGLSHDSINDVGAADDDVVDWLRKLNEGQLLDNTILIFMADHGNRFSNVRETLQGKQEERLPFFSFAFPDTFKKRFPQQYNNFVSNSERLTTPFDVHRTLQHILRLQQEEISSDVYTDNASPEEFHLDDTIQISKMASERAISLFDLIPKNRSCSDAYIEPHWCTCLNWETLEVNSSDNNGLLLKLAGSILNAINAAVSDYKSLCAHLTLNKINWAMRLLPHKELLTFKQSGDLDGFLADMSGKTQVENNIYQLQILVDPGKSLFEASVTYNVETKNATTKLSEISRINEYGKQANCIYNVNPELRKYCYCNLQ